MLIELCSEHDSPWSMIEATSRPKRPHSISRQINARRGCHYQGIGHIRLSREEMPHQTGKPMSALCNRCVNIFSPAFDHSNKQAANPRNILAHQCGSPSYTAGEKISSTLFGESCSTCTARFTNKRRTRSALQTPPTSSKHAYLIQRTYRLDPESVRQKASSNYKNRPNHDSPCVHVHACKINPTNDSEYLLRLPLLPFMYTNTHICPIPLQHRFMPVLALGSLNSLAYLYHERGLDPHAIRQGHGPAFRPQARTSAPK